MFYTLTMIDGHPELVDHETLADAELFAREVAEEGDDCTVLQVLSTMGAVEQPYQSLEEYYGVKAGVDFPATL